MQGEDIDKANKSGKPCYIVVCNEDGKLKCVTHGQSLLYAYVMPNEKTGETKGIGLRCQIGEDMTPKSPLDYCFQEKQK